MRFAVVAKLRYAIGKRKPNLFHPTDPMAITRLTL